MVRREHRQVPFCILPLAQECNQALLAESPEQQIVFDQVAASRSEQVFSRESVNELLVVATGQTYGKRIKYFQALGAILGRAVQVMFAFRFSIAPSLDLFDNTIGLHSKLAKRIRHFPRNPEISILIQGLRRRGSFFGGQWT